MNEVPMMMLKTPVLSDKQKKEVERENIAMLKALEKTERK